MFQKREPRQQSANLYRHTNPDRKEIEHPLQPDILSEIPMKFVLHMKQ
jgi:hypothetical protein